MTIILVKELGEYQKRVWFLAWVSEKGAESQGMVLEDWVEMLELQIDLVPNRPVTSFLCITPISTTSEVLQYLELQSLIKWNI